MRTEQRGYSKIIGTDFKERVQDLFEFCEGAVYKPSCLVLNPSIARSLRPRHYRWMSIFTFKSKSWNAIPHQGKKGINSNPQIYPYITVSLGMETPNQVH